MLELAPPVTRSHFDDLPEIRARLRLLDLNLQSALRFVEAAAGELFSRDRLAEVAEGRGLRTGWGALQELCFGDPNDRI